MDASEDYVSKRIIIGDSIGTILFYGEVPPTKGLWFGVDWDDPTRGKNDGSIGGVRYFQARTPTSGSFIRASNVDFGVSFLSAVRNKYEEIRDDSSPSVDVSNLSSLMKNIHARFVEVVGLDKVRQQQSCLDQLQVAILRNQRISSSDEKEEIMRICPSIRELDMSKNLIPSWEVVAEVTSALTNLTSLNVSENRLPVPPRISGLCESFSNLTHLVLARMGYTWEDVEPLLQLTSNLQHLQVPWNNINKLNQPSTSVKLNSIDLSGNPINDWNEINKLGNMTSLEVLNCAGTQIKEIRFPGEVYLPADYFQSLEKLYIQETPIYEYQSINELNRTGKLEVLRITQCPILNLHNPDTARQLMIAKISTLKILNGKEISASERKSSETDYIKMALVEKIKHSLSENDFKNMHPRYAVLIDQYGVPEFEDLDFNKRPPLTQVLLDIKLICPDCPQVKICKKFPKSMTVKRLRSAADRYFKFDHPGLVQLFLLTERVPTGEMRLSNDAMPLDYYHLKCGDTVIVKQMTPAELLRLDA